MRLHDIDPPGPGGEARIARLRSLWLPSVSRAARAGLAFLGLLALLVPLVGCGAGSQAQTAAQVAGTGGAGGDVGGIDVVDAAFIYQSPPVGDAVYRPGESARLRFSIVNTNDTEDRLVNITSPIARSSMINGDTRLLAHQVLASGRSAVNPVLADTKVIEAELRDLTQPVRAGLTYPVTFVFERAGQLTLELPVAYLGDPRGEGR